MHEMSCTFEKVVVMKLKKIIIVALLLNVFSQAGDITLTGTVVSDGQKMIGARFEPEVTSPSAMMFFACRMPNTTETTVMMMSTMTIGEKM